jgi:hypothetical protein
MDGIIVEQVFRNSLTSQRCDNIMPFRVARALHAPVPKEQEVLYGPASSVSLAGEAENRLRISYRRTTRLIIPRAAGCYPKKIVEHFAEQLWDLRRPAIVSPET